MKLVICAGPPTAGKTTLLKQVARTLIAGGQALAYLKIDVQFANEDEMFRDELGIPSRKIYSGDLCPDHCNVVVLGDAFAWALQEGADVFLVETAGLCLRCSPYVETALGIVVVQATSGMNLPRKIGPMLSLADMAIVTKIDLVSQAEREVFRANIKAAADVPVVDTNALHGINVHHVVRRIAAMEETREPLQLRGNPPLGTCTICVGKKEIGRQAHFGVLRALDTDIFYRGE
ncbi:MAG: cobalamin biosynthesis protein [Candidatus Brocadiaceae bacterium]|nr:cobalamin biosynthesis protein [Candidatus Brocadiaceae bacterium]